MNYEPIVGLEVHIQSKTKSKMFCSCSAEYFGSKPNTHTCPVCLGLPGALPVPNGPALDLCIKTALALNCEISKETKFDRKNYFYPDLPKGYQISQYDQPVGHGGYLEIKLPDGKKKKIGITRVHQEEDTGKSMHEGNQTLLDFNKSGVPLIEIVSEPEMSSVEEISAYAKEMHRLVRYLEVSDGDMEKGQMRFELNLSLKKPGDEGLPDYKVEVKNIGSISVLEKVFETEYKRQSELLDNGETPVQETRGLVDMSGKTVSQRGKEGEADYRYFPEPDIPPIEFSNEKIEDIRDTLPEMPLEKERRYVKDLKIDREIAETIVNDVKLARFFEAAVEKVDSELAIEVAKWIAGDYTALINDGELDSENVKPEHISSLVNLVSENKITGKTAKKVLKKCFETGKSPTEIVKNEGLEQVSDESKIKEIAQKVIKDNPKAVEDVKKNPNAIMFLVGQVMKEMKGKADPQTTRKLLESMI